MLKKFEKRTMKSRECVPLSVLSRREDLYYNKASRLQCYTLRVLRFWRANSAVLGIPSQKSTHNNTFLRGTPEVHQRGTLAICFTSWLYTHTSAIPCLCSISLYFTSCELFVKFLLLQPRTRKMCKLFRPTNLCASVPIKHTFLVTLSL
jgi:hypothetical protein